MYARAEARIDLTALRENCAELRRRIAPDVELAPVLKADGYGHGAAHCAAAALEAGVDRISVATAGEALEIRAMDPDVPILVLGALAPGEVEVAVKAGADISVWDPQFVDAVANASRAAGRVTGVHVKYDTGMGRLGGIDPEVVLAAADIAAESPDLKLEALWTHFATADDQDPAFMDLQRERLSKLGEKARAGHPGLKLHAANSAALILDSATHFDLVRPGVAIYGMDPFGRDPAVHNLRPVLSLHSYVATVKHFEPGMSAGYGRTWIASEPTTVVTVPVGYGDGVRRGLSNQGEVLIGGGRHRIAGTVSMDNITVDVGDAPVSVGDEVTLIGRQGDELITAEQVASKLDTINYEVTCGISPRVTRKLSGGSE
ncbi:MAG: alanine racemase [Solirubrobacterales bacterium]